MILETIDFNGKIPQTFSMGHKIQETIKIHLNNFYFRLMTLYDVHSMDFSMILLQYTAHIVHSHSPRKMSAF